MSVPTGFAISGNPITTSGTLALAFASGYSLPTTASQTNWDTAYDRSLTAFAYNTSTGVLTLTKQDATTLTATVTLQPFTTTDLTEGTNLYFTTARARQSLSAGTGISYSNVTGVITNSAPDQTVVLTGGTGISTSGTYPNFTITNTDPGSAQNIFKNIAVATQNTIVADSNNDTLTVVAGTGISITTDDTLDALTITNSAPDQVVSITGAGTSVVTGTYPNFTITSNDQYVGTVTSVAALTIGTTGTDLSSTVANSTTTPVITLNVPTASAINRGALSSADWSMFNAKQNAITLTTTGSSGSATFVADVLNIPTYTLSGLGGVPSTRTINGLALSSDQTFATGTTGTDFNIVSAGTVHTFNIPDASATARGLINSTTQTIAGTKTFTSSPIVPSLYLANMGAGSGAVYYNVSENRLTLANYNTGGEIKFEVNGGQYTMTLNSDLTIELMGYTTDGFLKTSGGNGLLVVDTTTYTPTARTLTINGTTYDLSANRTWSVGTVTSVGLSVPTGFSVASTPVTTSGTIALSFASGYSLPTNASQANWDTAYTNRIDSLTTTGTSGAATLVANVLNIPQYQAQGNYITSLTGEATASGPGAASVTLSNSAVIGKVLTGLTVTSGAIASTDSILSAFGKIQGQINALAGGLQYQGVWNANTNTPTITSGVGTDGYFYIVNVAGNTNIDGNTGWQVGDWIVFDGTVWQKVDNTDAVTSVNGFTGAVVLTTTNISEGTNLYYTDARARQAISLTTTGSSGAATYSNVTGVLNIPQYTLSGLGGVPTTRTLTINGTAYDLSADRTWSVGTVTSIATSGPITGGTITGSGTIGITQATSTTSGYLSSTDWNTFNSKQNAITLTVTGSSGPATLVGATLNIPEYTLSGLGGVPSTRTLTINGTSYDLSANRTWSVGTVTSITFSGPLTGGTITGSGTVGITQSSGSASGYLSSTDWTTFNNKQNAITLTTTGSSGAATLVGATLNIPNYSISGLGGVPTSRTLTINGTAYDLSADRSWSVGTVTSVGATAGTGISVSGSPITSSGSITITNTAPDQTVVLNNGTGISVTGTYPNFTITNTSPSPANTVTGTGTTDYLARWTSSSTIGTGTVRDDGTYVGIGTAPTSSFKVDVSGNIRLSTGQYITGYTTSSLTGYSLTPTNFNIGSVYANALTTFDGSSTLNINGYRSQFQYTLTGVGASALSLQPFLAYPVVSLTGANARIDATGFTAYIWRTDPADISTNGSNRLRGAYVIVGNRGGNGITGAPYTNTVAGYESSIENGGGTVNNMYGIRTYSWQGEFAANSTTNNLYGVYQGMTVGAASGGAHVVTNFYAFYQDTPTVLATGSITNRWGLYFTDSSMPSYHNGNLLLGTNTSAGSFKLQVSGATYLNGNVSIGTTYNGFPLNVNGTAYVIGGNIYVSDGYSIRAAAGSPGITFYSTGTYIGIDSRVQVAGMIETTSGRIQAYDNIFMLNGEFYYGNPLTSTALARTYGSGTGLSTIWNVDVYNGSGWISLIDGLATAQLRFPGYTSSSSFTGTAAGYLAFDSSGNLITTANGGVGGSGTTSYVARWTGTNTLGTGVLYDNGTNVGISLTTPQKKLDVYGSGIIASFASSLSVGNIGGIHFGYSESYLGNDLYKKSALVFERTDAYTGQGGNAGGKIHFLLNNTGSASATSLSSAVVTIDSNSSGTNGSVRMGVGTTSPLSTLSVSGPNTGSLPLVDLIASGTGTFQRGVRLLNSGMNSGDHIMMAVGQADSSRNMGQFYFYYSSSGSTANRLSMGLHSVDDVFNIQGTGDITIGSTTNSGLAKLQVTGAIQQTSVTSSMLKTDSNGVLVAAAAGTDYLTPTNSNLTYNASLTLSTSWQDTGVSNSNLTADGVYIVTCYVNDFGVSGGQYTVTYTGLMYWYASSTNNTNYSEIALHHMGHADNDRYIYLRTRTTPSNGGTFLQIKGNGNNSGASTYVFNFKRLL